MALRLLQPVDTTTAALVGEHPSGPLDSPVLVTSARDLGRTFGSARGRLLDAARHFFANGGARLYLLPFTDFEQEPEAAFARLDEIDDFSIVASPGYGSGAVIEAGAGYCERRADCFFLADSPAGAGPAEVSTLVEGLGVRSSYAALYFPWLNPASPVPASGFVAGVLARTAASHGVWRTPAGPDAVLRGAEGLTYSLSDSDRADLNSLGVNVLRTCRSAELTVWGAQTLAPPAQAEWKYVPVRRTAIFLEQSIARGTGWAVFEHNDEPLWSMLRRSIEAFLTTQWRLGAFRGAKPEEAYFVSCDRTTMTQTDIDAGNAIVLIGFAPLRPAEFVILRIQLRTASSGTDS